jgi:hypothetical protein
MGEEMNTLDFLRAILPEEGVKYLVLINENGRVAHRPYTNLEKMASSVAYWDAQDLQVYYACAAYKEEFVWVEEKGVQKKKYRVPSNQLKAKAFWIDIDCGEKKFNDGEGYLTKKDAFQALKQFCETTDLPMPYLVDSGNGVHGYWILEKTIPVETWTKLAAVLKALTTHLGIKADPTCTADFARILRPVGATHKKEEPKPVRGQKSFTPIPAKEFAAKLIKLKQDMNLTISVPKPEVAQDLNADLIAHLPPQIPVFADEVASKCGQVGEMQKTGGNVGYEQWRGVIGILKYCEDGVTKIHKWSEGHPQYDPVDTVQKYESWSTPPTTCEFFSKCNPTGCEGCAFKGKVKTPLVLGRREPEQKAEEIEAKVDGEIIKVQIPELPKGYGVEHGQMVTYKKDKDDIMHSFPFAYNLFYPLYRIRKEGGEFSLAMRMHLPDQRTRDFEIDTQLLASPQKLLEGLARHELVATNTKEASLNLTAYLRDSLEKLKREAEELNTYTSFGWQDEFQSFLIGDRLYMKDGTKRKVLIGGYAKSREIAFPTPKGTVEGYTKALNFMYNRPHMEHIQYVVASAFGSILTPFCDPLYKGIVFAVISPESAKGKTTACWAGLYPFGDADKMTMKTEEQATLNARYAWFGTQKNIPVLMDELTNIDTEEWSRSCYTVSLGQERERLTVGKGNSGIKFAEAQTWAMTVFVTANKDLHSLLAARQSNTQAEAVRMIQIDVDRYKLPDLAIAEVETAMRQMQLNKGTAGELFVQHVVSNLDDVLASMGQWGRRIQQDIPDVKYRFYRNQAITALTALEITNKLKITEFEIEPVYNFIIQLFHELAITVAEQNSITPEDALNRMLNDLSPRVMVTTEYRDGRDSRGPEDVRSINGAIAGRYIIGSNNTRNDPISGKLYLVRKEVTDWCLKHRVDPKTVMNAAMKNGYMSEPKDKFNIGRGTRVSAGQHRCVEIDMVKLEAAGAPAPRLTVHKGTKLEGSQVAND